MLRRNGCSRRRAKRSEWARGNDMGTGIVAAVASLLVGMASAHGRQPPTIAPPAAAETVQPPAATGADAAKPPAGASNDAVLPSTSNPPAAELLPPPRPIVSTDAPADNVFAGGAQSTFNEFTAGLDYLLGYFPNSPGNNIIAVEPGVATLLGQTLVRASDDNLYRRTWSGGRLTLGYWIAESNPFNSLMPVRGLGIESRVFSLGQRSLTAVNATAPTILRPFFDLNNREDTALVVASPGFSTGGVVATAKMNMWGAEANIWRNLYDNGTPTTFGVSFIAGYRYLETNPEIRINQVSVYNDDLSAFDPSFASFAGNMIEGVESFSARNQFNGGQFGINLKAYGSRFIFDTTLKVALGANQETLSIQGSQVRTFAAGSQVASQGLLLALPSNIGTFSKVKFAQVPELNVGVVVPMLPWLTLRTDFSALYISRFIRAGSQINRVIDITQIPNYPPNIGVPSTGLGLPTVLFNQSDLWMLGISVGMELKW